MLEELLNSIKEGGSFDKTFLAKKLNTTPEMVEAMIEHLTRAGLIKNYEPGCSSCDHCALSGACDPEKRKREIGHLWVYEERNS